MSSTLSFIILEEDELLVSTLEKLIGKAFPDAIIIKSNDGIEGLNMIKKQIGNCIVMCSQYLPNLNGLQIVQMIKSDETFKRTYFITITTSLDKEDNLKALQFGADALLYKPVSIDELLSKLRTAARIFNMQNDLDKYLKKFSEIESQIDKDINNIISILDEAIVARMPDSAEQTKSIIESSVYIARQSGGLDNNAIEDIKKAARMIFLGRMSFPDKLLNEPIFKNGLLANEAMLKVPTSAHAILSRIRKYDKAAVLLKHLFENFDGSGIPDKLQAAQIPLGARILRVAYDFEEMLAANRKNYNVAMEEIYKENKRLYDYKIVAYFDQYLASKSKSNTSRKEKAVGIKELKEGDILSRNILINSGLILLGSATHMTFDQIEKIENINQTDPIIGNIFIYS